MKFYFFKKLIYSIKKLFLDENHISFPSGKSIEELKEKINSEKYYPNKIRDMVHYYHVSGILEKMFNPKEKMAEEEKEPEHQDNLGAS